MNSKDYRTALDRSRIVADELSTANTTREVDPGTRGRIAKLLGKNTLVTWHNSLEASPLKTSVKKLIEYLARVYALDGQTTITWPPGKRESRIVDASRMIPQVCDQIERMTTKTIKPGPKKTRINWDELQGKALAMIESDRSKLGWSTNHWGRALGVAKSTFAESSLAKLLERLAMADKITSLTNDDE